MSNRPVAEPIPEQTENGLHEGDEFLTPEELNELIKEVVIDGKMDA